jgi:predicted metal-dependent enzyme (double-stranded beta helix superfamily)
VGVLRGSETAQAFALDSGGRPLPTGKPRLMLPGDVETLSPTAGDIHQVRNARDDQVSISIHVYGGDIGSIERSSYTPAGERARFISHYAVPG